MNLARTIRNTGITHRVADAIEATAWIVIKALPLRLDLAVIDLLEENEVGMLHLTASTTEEIILSIGETMKEAQDIVVVVASTEP